MLRLVQDFIKKAAATWTAPLVKARKGYHKEVAAWAEREGYRELIVDGKRCAIGEFPSLERYREHTIDVVIAQLKSSDEQEIQQLAKNALRIGNDSAFLLRSKAMVKRAPRPYIATEGWE